MLPKVNTMSNQNLAPIAPVVRNIPFVQTKTAIQVLLTVLGAEYPVTLNARKYTDMSGVEYLKFATVATGYKGWEQTLVFADRISPDLIKKNRIEDLLELTNEIVFAFEQMLEDNISFNPNRKTTSIGADYIYRSHGQIAGCTVYSHQFGLTTNFFVVLKAKTSKFAVCPTEGRPTVAHKTSSKSYVANKAGTLKTVEAAVKAILGL